MVLQEKSQSFKDFFMPFETISPVTVAGQLITLSGGVDAPDAIAIWRGEGSGNPISCDTPGVRMWIRNPGCPNTQLRVGDVLMVFSENGANFAVRQITNLNACTPCPPAGPGCPSSGVGNCDAVVTNPGLAEINPPPGSAGANFTGGTAQFFRRIVYYVVPDPQDPQKRNLMRCDNCTAGGGGPGGEVLPVRLATDVEDFQVAYIDRNGVVYDDPATIPIPGGAWDVRRVRLNLLTRTSNPDPILTNNRPALEDHLAGPDDNVETNNRGGFRRRLLLEEVQVRNLRD
jgi:hypothetical protein